MLQSGGQFAGPVNTTAIDHHHHLFSRGAKDVHHLVDILTEFVGIKMGHNFIEDARGAILHRADDIEQDAAGDATPATVGLPGLTFEPLLGIDLALAQRAGGQTVALAASPPAAPGQGKTPEHRLILVEQNDLALARPIFQGRKFETAIGQIGRVGIESARGATVAQRVFFNAKRTLSRPIGTPLCWLNTPASARQLHCEWIEPCVRGS
jgi:hypothetical protein